MNSTVDFGTSIRENALTMLASQFARLPEKTEENTLFATKAYPNPTDGGITKFNIAKKQCEHPLNCRYPLYYCRHYAIPKPEKMTELDIIHH